VRSESDIRPDDDRTARESEPLTTADLAASRARLGIARELENPANETRTATPAGTPLSSPAASGATAATGARLQRVTDAAAHDDDTGPLLPHDESGDFRARWEKIQVGFVDEPRRAVEHADNLVAETMQRPADTFARERENLEGQWDRGGEVSTEDLRLALRRYRTFFGRLVQI
jgi:hypothetical protein